MVGLDGSVMKRLVRGGVEVWLGSEMRSSFGKGRRERRRMRRRGLADGSGWRDVIECGRWRRRPWWHVRCHRRRCIDWAWAGNGRHVTFGFLFVDHARKYTGIVCWNPVERGGARKYTGLVCWNPVRDRGGILLLFEPSTAEQNSGYEASDPNHHANDDPPDGFGRDLGFSMNGARWSSPRFPSRITVMIIIVGGVWRLITAGAGIRLITAGAGIGNITAGAGIGNISTCGRICGVGIAKPIGGARVARQAVVVACLLHHQHWTFSFSTVTMLGAHGRKAWGKTAESASLTSSGESR